MKVRIRYNRQLGQEDEDIEVAYLSLYPNKGFDTTDSDPICFLELKEAHEGSRIRHIDLTEVENLWFRDESVETP